MNAPAARDVLTIFRAGDEVSGLSFYGLIAPHQGIDTSFPTRYWPGSPSPSAHVSELHDDSWSVFVWDVALSEWPSDEAWADVVRATLDALLGAGFVVAWIGREGYFADPPDLFLPSCMTGGVLAAATRDGFFACPLQPSKPLAYLTDNELLQLRARSRGLAGEP